MKAKTFQYLRNTGFLFLAGFFSLLTAAYLQSCSISDPLSQDESGLQISELAGQPKLPTLHLNFMDPNGSVFLSYSHSSAGGSVVDANGKKLLEFIDTREKEDKSSKILDCSGNTIAYIRIPQSERILLLDQFGNKQLELDFSLELADMFKVKNRSGAIVYIVDKRQGNVCLLDGMAEKLIAFTKRENNKTSLCSAAGKELLSSRSDMPGQALCLFKMAGLSKTEQFILSYTLIFMRL